MAEEEKKEPIPIRFPQPASEESLEVMGIMKGMRYGTVDELTWAHRRDTW